MPSNAWFAALLPQKAECEGARDNGAFAKHDSLAERSKAVAQGAIPKGRGFEPHSCHSLCPRAAEGGGLEGRGSEGGLSTKS